MAKELTFSYHPASDELNIHLAEPRPAISKEISDEVYMRVDRETGQIIGLTVMHFQARFGRRKSPDLSFALPIVARLTAKKKAA